MLFRSREAAITVKVATEVLKINKNYLVLKPGGTYQLESEVTPKEASQSITYSVANSEVATVTESGMITAIACGSTSIIVSNGDTSKAVSVIVNEEQKKEEKSEKNSNSKTTEKKYKSKMTTEECPIVTKDMLKYFYQEKKKLIITGEGYSIYLDGCNIKNCNNELYTEIEFNKKNQEFYFSVNQGAALCGKITLFLNNQKGRYLYLYNESKNRYQLIEHKEETELVLTMGGEYVLTNKEIDDQNINKYVVPGISGILIVLAGAYVWIKKRYWFW